MRQDLTVQLKTILRNESSESDKPLSKVSLRKNVPRLSQILLRTAPNTHFLSMKVLLPLVYLARKTGSA